MFADFIWDFVKKILPWTLLIMFVSFGIAYIAGGGNIVIQENGQVMDSYLYMAQNGTQTYYVFRFDEYMRGLNFTDVFNNWKYVFTQFSKFEFTNGVWKWDSVINALISIANIFIAIINLTIQIVNILVILPTILIAQTLTVIFRILGQKINSESVFWLSQWINKVNTWTTIPIINYIPVQ